MTVSIRRPAPLALLVVLLASLGVTAAPRSAAAGPDEDKADAVLRELASAADAPTRLRLAAELTPLAPRIIPHLATFLTRTRTSTVDQRRLVLVGIRASVPDAKGKFETPKRQQEAQIRADEAFDWLAELVTVDAATPGAAEVLADVVVVRALADSREQAAAQVIFDAAFAEPTQILRDECGRRLRKMAPVSLPALIIESQGKGDRKRYSNYQLERLDRQDPAKALIAAVDAPGLEVAILDAFRTSRHREAVYAVLSKVDDDAPAVRAAARAAWMAYVTGPPPPPAPKKKMVLPGGKLANKETPLWLTYRELADHELRGRLEQLLGEVTPEGQKLDLEAASKRLFAHFDGERQKRDAGLLASARELAGKGDLAGAAAAFDRLIVLDPERPERAEMAPVFLDLGRALGKDGKWAEAAEAFSKAHGLAPEGKDGVLALAAHHHALGKALEAAGKDGDGQFREAARIDPSFQAAAVAEGAAPPSDRSWLLAAGAGAAVAALALFAAGIVRRRRPA